MKKLIYIVPILTVLLIVCSISSCKKALLFSEDHLSFSVDTVVFDTVFTTIGSTTKRFKIYNKSKRPVHVDRVTLVGGENSPYRINLDGVAGTQFKDIEIPSEDSLFCFVEVTLGENSDTEPEPLIIEDKITFKTNGEEQSVKLAAWGRDAYFHYNDSNDGSWYNDKPHVIYGAAFVDSNKTLNIPAGTEVYLHKGAMLYVHGALHIDGDYNNKVVFQGDRLEPFYEDVKGQYYGIYFDEAQSSTIDNAIIKNGTAGIHIYGNNTTNTGPTLTISNTEIYNHSSYGIFNYGGGSVVGTNLNIHDNNAYAYFVLEGGDCDFRQCQFLSWGSDGNQPAVAVKNYFTHNDDGLTYIGNINTMNFYNSIIHGGGDIQIGFDTISEPSAAMNYDFRYNLIKQKPFPTGSAFSNNVKNKSPKFKNIGEQEYKIKSSSPCIESGNAAYSTTMDIEGTSRSGVPDIGAYEVSN